MINRFMRFPGGKAKCLTLSYDDGVVQDVRLIGIMKEHGLRGTFNLNSNTWADRDYDDGRTNHRRLTKERAIKLYTESGFEVAVHAADHPWLEQLPTAAATKNILEDRISLERDFGGIIRGSAYPYGTYNADVLKALEACGIVYARTVNSTHGFELPANWLELHPTCHHGDPRLGELTERFLNDTPHSRPYFFYLWGHSYEYDWNDNWNIIEDFAARTGGRDDIWYATNIEAYDYVQDYKRLTFNTDMTLCHNASAQTIWFADDTKLYKVEPGETIKISE